MWAGARACSRRSARAPWCARSRTRALPACCAPPGAHRARRSCPPTRPAASPSGRTAPPERRAPAGAWSVAAYARCAIALAARLVGKGSAALIPGWGCTAPALRSWLSSGVCLPRLELAALGICRFVETPVWAAAVIQEDSPSVCILLTIVVHIAFLQGCACVFCTCCSMSTDASARFEWLKPCVLAWC